MIKCYYVVVDGVIVGDGFGDEMHSRSGAIENMKTTRKHTSCEVRLKYIKEEELREEIERTEESISVLREKYIERKKSYLAMLKSALKRIVIRANRAKLANVDTDKMQLIEIVNNPDTPDEDLVKYFCNTLICNNFINNAIKAKLGIEKMKEIRDASSRGF